MNAKFFHTIGVLMIVMPTFSCFAEQAGGKITETTFHPESFSCIDIKVSRNTSVTVEQGTGFSVTYLLAPKEALKTAEVKNDTLCFYTTAPKSIFGRNSTPGKYSVTVTVPDRTTLQKISISSSEGSIYINDIEAHDIACSSGTGYIFFNGVTAQSITGYSATGYTTASRIATDSLILSSSNGNITVKEVQSKDMDVSTVMGSINVDGTVSGFADIRTTMGNIDCTIQNITEEVSLAAYSKAGVYIDNKPMGDILVENNGEFVGEIPQRIPWKLETSMGQIYIQFPH